MKKSLFALCALALAFAACDKTEEPQIVPELKLTTEAAITVPQEGDIINVTFESNVNWTATLDVEKDVASLNVKNGTKEEGKVKITVMPLTEDNAVRNFTLTLTPEGGEPVKVAFTQNGPYVPFFEVSETSFAFGVEGGAKSFTISTNVKYDVANNTDFATLSIGEEAKLTVEANKKWGVRSGSFVFTVPAIQVPKVDDNGNVVEGEMVAKTVTITVSQEGTAFVDYTQQLSEDLVASTVYNTALTSEYFLVANGSNNVYAFNRKDGSFVASMDATFPVSSMANDDAGNIVIMTGGDYEGDLSMYFIPASTPLDKSTYVKAFDAKNDYYGIGFNNLSVNGDVFNGDALITVFSGGNGAVGCVAWVIKDGKRADDNNYTDYVGFDLGESAIWNSKWGQVRHVSTNVNGGLYFAGYVEPYGLYYNPGMSKANWVKVGESYGSWMDGTVAMEIVNWNGKKYMVTYNMGLFSYAPAKISLYDIADPSTPVYIDTYSFTTEYTFVEYKTADMSVAVEDGNLVVYFVDYSRMGIGRVILK